MKLLTALAATPALVRPSVLHCETLMADSILEPIGDTNFISNDKEFFLDGANASDGEKPFKPVSGKNFDDKATPTACCGAHPYDSSKKGCCQVPATLTSGVKNVVYNQDSQGCCTNEETGVSKLFESASQGCCSGNTYSKESLDCCEGTLTDPTEFPGCRCGFEEWSGWSTCDANFGGGFQSRTREYVPLEGFEGSTCPNVPRKQADLSTEKRQEDPEEGGESCVSNVATNMYNKKIINSKYYKDLIILLDESTSIKENNFEYAKDLVINIVNSLCGGIGPNKNRVSVVRYSASVKVDIKLTDSYSTDEVVNTVSNFNYNPIEDAEHDGTTWTATAMDYIYDNVLSTDMGWRDGVGPAKCNGVMLGDSCYAISSSKVDWANIGTACQNDHENFVPVTDLSDTEFKALQLLVAETKEEQDLPWLGLEYQADSSSFQNFDGELEVTLDQMTNDDQSPWSNIMWENDVAQVHDATSDSCIKFTRERKNDVGTYKLTSGPCNEVRPVLCKMQPAEYLQTSTELLLITDGRSNDPKKFGYKLKSMKEKFNAVGVDVAAIGVGRINQDEIRDLTDDRPGQILYLMSWQSVNTFNAILTRLLESYNYDADVCLPLEVDTNDLVWQQWYQVMLEEGINVRSSEGGLQSGRTVGDPNGNRKQISAGPYKEPEVINLNSWGIDNNKLSEGDNSSEAEEAGAKALSNPRGGRIQPVFTDIRGAGGAATFNTAGMFDKFFG